MIAIQVAKATTPAQAVVPAQLHTRSQQALAQAQGEGQRTIIIEQATHLHAALGGLHQGLDHGFGASAGFDQVQFQVHLILGAHDCGEHAREKLRTVDQ
ncbi:hypothetical protein D3C77_675860 [compost metagenome]